jgi:hypothetical protein
MSGNEIVVSTLTCPLCRGWSVFKVTEIGRLLVFDITP